MAEELESQVVNTVGTNQHGFSLPGLSATGLGTSPVGVATGGGSLPGTSPLRLTHMLSSAHATTPLLTGFGPTGWSPPPSPLSGRSTPLACSTGSVSLTSAAYAASSGPIQGRILGPGVLSGTGVSEGLRSPDTHLSQSSQMLLPFYSNQSALSSLTQQQQLTTALMSRSRHFDSQHRSVSAMGQPLHQVIIEAVCNWACAKCNLL
ncbi:unnamed protein product [Protopolystoma xenopodis]|uniref:Uncharacterized protein n=1 Tax=Protopolystoma xenopodis TaxID=117903 RepID=A0A3S4ZE17_9PLAT|nr:unnamed protein product [Protopolystoma xenopodis]